MDEPTRDGKHFIERWQRAIKALQIADRAKNIAECELTNARDALGGWMVPDDVRIGETIGVWNGDSLISVTKTDGSGNGTFNIEIRKAGRKTLLADEQKEKGHTHGKEGKTASTD